MYRGRSQERPLCVRRVIEESLPAYVRVLHLRIKIVHVTPIILLKNYISLTSTGDWCGDRNR